MDMSRLPVRLDFEAFEALPCGCVAGAYRAMPWAFSLVRLDAKGPHCLCREHAVDQVLDVALHDDEEGGAEEGSELRP